MIHYQQTSSKNIHKHMTKNSIVQPEFIFDEKPAKPAGDGRKSVMRESPPQKMISGTIAYKKYGIPRSMLRSLVDQGLVRMEEKTTGGPFVLKLYHQGDIESYLNGR